MDIQAPSFTYENLRSVARTFYTLLYDYVIPFLAYMCRFFTQPLGDSISEGLDLLDVTNSPIIEAVNKVLGFITNSSLSNMSLLQLMLGAGIIIYLTYSIVKFVLDIIF